MYKIKIYLNVSIKKLKKLQQFKNKTLNNLLFFILKENNLHFNIILKKLNIFIDILQQKSEDKCSLAYIKKNIILKNINFLIAKKFKRFEFRAKGKTDLKIKQNSFIILILDKKEKEENIKLKNKNYYYGKKN